VKPTQVKSPQVKSPTTSTLGSSSTVPTSEEAEALASNRRQLWGTMTVVVTVVTLPLASSAL
jgi:hypothetical protein